VAEFRRRLSDAGVLERVEVWPNVDRVAKIRFMRALSVVTVPARYVEAFGLYLLEAMAAGVPAVQPRTAAFPEMIEETGAGILCEPDDPESLALEIERLLLDPVGARNLGCKGQEAVSEKFTAAAMAREMVRVCKETCALRPAEAVASAVRAGISECN